MSEGKSYEGPSQNYTNLEVFKETAIKTLNNIYGRPKPFDVFDFSEYQKDGLTYWRAVAFHENKAPAPVPVGEVIENPQTGAPDIVGKGEADVELKPSKKKR